ncbi:hypothetical protein [Streptomyces sp. NPDC060184]|uniref:hypothetical protein n=1 Tax=Streptomyces sp. NPDC060184 TaxID=3347064 RepID=UPI0036699A09
MVLRRAVLRRVVLRRAVLRRVVLRRVTRQRVARRRVLPLRRWRLRVRRLRSGPGRVQPCRVLLRALGRSGVRPTGPDRPRPMVHRAAGPERATDSNPPGRAHSREAGFPASPPYEVRQPRGAGTRPP